MCYYSNTLAKFDIMVTTVDIRDGITLLNWMDPGALQTFGRRTSVSFSVGDTNLSCLSCPVNIIVAKPSSEPTLESGGVRDVSATVERGRQSKYWGAICLSKTIRKHVYLLLRIRYRRFQTGRAAQRNFPRRDPLSAREKFVAGRAGTHLSTSGPVTSSARTHHINERVTTAAEFQ